jgi:ectoine hydroxylase-related dioxygenase (phytanoyl-CoA dioxygenase family)
MRFLSDDHQQTFEQLGYLHVPGMLDSTTLQTIRAHFDTLTDQSFDFYTSNWVADESYKRSTHDFLKPILDNATTPYLKNFRSVFSYYLIKKSSENTKVAIHQDWSLIDESRYTGITLWIPLVDTHESNGWFCVVPHSHKIFRNIRGTHIGMPYSDYGDWIEEKMVVPIPAKAGDAIFFDHQLLHYSPPNRSEQIRMAAWHVLIPDYAPMLHYFKQKESDDSIRQIPVKDDFLLKHSFGQGLEWSKSDIREITDNTPTSLSTFRRSLSWEKLRYLVRHPFSSFQKNP